MKISAAVEVTASTADRLVEKAQEAFKLFFGETEFAICQETPATPAARLVSGEVTLWEATFKAFQRV